VAFRFQNAGCVVVGSFNIHILHPQWLVKWGIIEKGLEVGIETNLTRPGLRLRFPQQEALWSISPDRLVIETQDPAFDCGRTVAKVLAILRETPVFAIGNNVNYTAELAEAEQLPGTFREFPQTAEVPAEFEFAQRTLHFAVNRGENETINVQVAIKDEETELLGNAHYSVGNNEDPNAAAVAAAERFFSDRVETESVVRRLFGVVIEHDGDNA
jgi:hypothetical protein